MADADGQSQFVGQILDLDLEKAGAGDVAPASVRSNDQFCGTMVGFPSHQSPLATNAFHGKGGRVMIGSDIDLAFILLNIIDAVGESQ